MLRSWHQESFSGKGWGLSLYAKGQRSTHPSDPPIHGAGVQVRATNLQELVYKQGQAGTTKATVSITWHNDDPENGPSGCEDKEYITITRQVCTVN